MGGAARFAIVSAAIPTTCVTTSSRVAAISASCSIAMDRRAGSRPHNAGPGRYDEALNGRPLPAETRAYVATVASAIGSGGTMMAAADPLAWIRAPLFIAQPDRRSAADPVPPGRSSVTARMQPRRAIFSAIVPRLGGLFVARSGDRTTP